MGGKYDPLTGMPSEPNHDYQTLLEMWRTEKSRRPEVEGELSIIKGIGNNSPEMKALQKRVEEVENSLSIALEINDKYQREEKKLKEELAREKDDREYDQLVHKRELADLFKGRWPKMDGSG